MVLIKSIADYVEGAGMHVIEVRRLGDDISPRKITTFPPTFQIFSQKKLSTASTPYTQHLTPAAPLPIKPTFLHKKRRSPALNHFALGCQRRVALPTQTKDYLRIVMN